MVDNYVDEGDPEEPVALLTEQAPSTSCRNLIEIGFEPSHGARFGILSSGGLVYYSWETWGGLLMYLTDLSSHLLGAPGKVSTWRVVHSWR